MTRLDTPGVVASDGLAFAPGRDILYVADPERPLDPDDAGLGRHIFAYDADDDGNL